MNASRRGSGLEERIRSRGSELGFVRVSFSAAGPAPRAELFRRWLERGFHGEMDYLGRDAELRADVTRRSPWARTVISAALRYAPSPVPRTDGAPGLSGFVSRYALGKDYHKVLKRRLDELGRFVRDEGGGRVEARSLVDTSAILERDHASASGLGWTGKNAMVIDPQEGSYLFLGEILTDLELQPGSEMEDLCGGCTRCIDACPTGAIVEARILDARRCISYLTIELRGAVAAPLRAAIGDHLFGCDVCQEVCPWNRESSPAQEPEFLPGPGVERTSLEEAVTLDAAEFSARFRDSAVSRARRNGFVRNALIVSANRGELAALRAGRAVLEDPDPALRETAVWALAKGEPADRRASRSAAEREPDDAVRRRMLEATE